MLSRTSVWRHFDLWLLAAVLVLTAYGVLMIQQRLDDLLAELPSQPDTDGKRVYWPSEGMSANWAGLRQAGDRGIDEVPEAELMNCAREALKQLLVADEDTVTRYMGNLLGQQRVTRQAQEKLAVGLDGLRRLHEVQEVAGGLRLVSV